MLRVISPKGNANPNLGEMDATPVKTAKINVDNFKCWQGETGTLTRLTIEPKK